MGLGAMVCFFTAFALMPLADVVAKFPKVRVETLDVTNVDMQADPMDFRLIRQLNGKDFPYPWAGQITGWARGPGGPLDRFDLDSASPQTAAT